MTVSCASSWSASTAPSGVSKRSARRSCSHRPSSRPCERRHGARYTCPAARTGFDAAHWVEMLTEEASAARDAAAAILGDRPDSAARIVPGERPTGVTPCARTSSERRCSRSGARHSSRFLGIMLGDTASELLHDGTCSVLRGPPAAGQDVAAASRHHRSRRLRACTRSPRDGGRARGPTRCHGRGRLCERRLDRPGGRLDRTGSTAGTRHNRSLPSSGAHDGTDLVVVGSRGLHGLHALGSVSERVAHHAQCSVLVVHDGTAVGGGA